MRAATQFLLEPLQVQATADAGADRVLADVLAIAQDLVRVEGRVEIARWCAQRRKQPAPQLLVRATFEPQPLQPVLGKGFTGQSNGSDPAIFDPHALAYGPSRVVVSQYRAVIERQVFIDFA
ncbi:hypothetical protein D3C76_690550 [compost metagenome]